MADFPVMIVHPFVRTPTGRLDIPHGITKSSKQIGWMDRIADSGLPVSDIVLAGRENKNSYFEIL